MLDHLGLVGQSLRRSEMEGVFLGAGIHPEDLRLVAPNNADAADTTNADQLRGGGGLGLNLDGAGLTVGVWDSGDVRATHQEFGGRVTVVDAVANSNHSTHVAGTIGAAGVDPQARGMADQVAIRSRDWNNDMAELAADAALIVASNHSYGSTQGWNIPDGSNRDEWLADRSTFALEDPDFGMYDDGAAGHWTRCCMPTLTCCRSGLRRTTETTPSPTSRATIFTARSCRAVSAATRPPGWYLVPNAGATAAPPSDGNGGTGYDSLPNGGGQTAKNTLVVGAIEDITADPYPAITMADMSTFSSWGPTDDGRIGVDVVGNGVGLWSTIATRATPTTTG